MPQVYQGRYTAKVPSSFVVFVIGMRINSFWAVRKWWPTVMAMPPMIRALDAEPAKGYLGSEMFYRFFPITTLMMTYWRSFDDLERFAKNPSDPHLKSWGRFMKDIGDDGSVGIWHETYLVEQGAFESIYGNMPRFGLAKAFEHVQISTAIDSARQRIDRAS